MKTKFAIPFLSLTIAIGAISCNNQQKPAAQTEAHHEHDGHDGHDHSAHEHTTASSSASNPATEAPKVKAANLTIPDFTFFHVKSGMPFSKEDIAKGKNTVFVLFDPSCNHCQNETRELAKNYNQVKDINIYYVSMNDPALMANFLSTFGKELDGKPNVAMLYDKNQEFVQRFHIPNMFPANYVYGADGNLKTYWEGEKAINDIIKEFHK